MATKEKLVQDILDANEKYGWDYEIPEVWQEIQRLHADVMERISVEEKGTDSTPPVPPAPATPAPLVVQQVRPPEPRSFDPAEVMKNLDEDGYEDVFLPAVRVDMGATFEHSINGVKFTLYAGKKNKQVPVCLIPYALIWSQGFVKESEIPENAHDFRAEMAAREFEEANRSAEREEIMVSRGIRNFSDGEKVYT